MSELVAFQDIQDRRIYRKMPVGYMYRTQFITHKEEPAKPHIFMIESSENRVLDTHFHDVDQFQIVVGGTGKLGRHDLAPYSVHFARAFTPYGPLIAGPGNGVSYMTIRAHRDPVPKAQKLTTPGCREKLMALEGRLPWQVTAVPKVPELPKEGVEMHTMPSLTDDRGLAAAVLSMAPNTTVAAPDPSLGDGQCIVILKGSLRHKDTDKNPLTVHFVEAKDGAVQIRAGNQGLVAFVLNFPRPIQYGETKTPPPTAAASTVWQCRLCSFAYDPDAGLPSEGIKAGTAWENVPHDWTCPDCSATKSEFDAIEL